MSAPFDRFTKRALRVLTLTQEESQRLNHRHIGTEHLLLGLIREGDGSAGRALDALGVQLAQVRSAIALIIGRGETMVRGEIALTPRAKTVLHLAVDEAERLGHRQIGTGHLLLGLLREGGGIGIDVLRGHGLAIEQVRDAVLTGTGLNPDDSLTTL